MTAGASLKQAQIGLTIGDVHMIAVEVPMTFPLGTSAAVVRIAPLLLIDIETKQGVRGRTYLFGYRGSGSRAIAAMIEDIAEPSRASACRRWRTLVCLRAALI